VVGAWNWLRSSKLRIVAASVGILAILVLFGLETLLSKDPGFLREFFERLSEALLIASILSLVLDGPAKTEIAGAAAKQASHEWRKMSLGSLWVILNPNAWDEHKAMVMEMARKKTFFAQVDWVITVQEDKPPSELLRLSVQVEVYGQSFEPPGTFPHTDLPLLASSNGSVSRHTGFYLWRDTEKGGRDTLIEANDALINDPSNELVDTRSDGATVLHVDRLRTEFSIDHVHLDADDRFTMRQMADVFRHRRGFFPMWSFSTSVKNSVRVVNETELQLNFTLARLHELEIFSLTSDVVQQIGLMPPGCAFVLSWAEPHKLHFPDSAGQPEAPAASSDAPASPVT
jgi:hypothetical protein